jgi:hypothetical protein
MNQPQSKCVQGLARKDRRQMRLAVQRVSDQGETQGLHMHANLMRAPCFEFAANQADWLAVKQPGRQTFVIGSGRL